MSDVGALLRRRYPISLWPRDANQVAHCRLEKGPEDLFPDLKINAMARSRRFIHGARLIPTNRRSRFKPQPKDGYALDRRWIATVAPAKRSCEFPRTWRRESPASPGRARLVARSAKSDLMMIAMRASGELCNIVQYRWKFCPPWWNHPRRAYRESFTRSFEGFDGVGGGDARKTWRKCKVKRSRRHLSWFEIIKYSTSRVATFFISSELFSSTLTCFRSCARNSTES